MTPGERRAAAGEAVTPLSPVSPVVNSTPLVGEAAAPEARASPPTPINEPASAPTGLPLGIPSSASTVPTQVMLAGGIDDPTQVRVSTLDVGRDRAAAIIAGMLIGCFVLAVFLPALAEMLGVPLSAEVRSQLDKASTALIGLLGAVIAFYFSDKRLR